MTKSLASYQELVKITDDFYSLINSQRGGKLALIQAPQRNPDANADNHPPNGNSILPFSLKISLVPPPPKEFEDNIKTIPDKENNVYDEGYGIDLSSEFHYSNIAKIDNYAENPTFFDDNLDKIVFIQAKALSKLSPFLISLGRADEVNAFFDKVLSYDISSAEKFALHSLSVPISTAYANNASVNRNILPFAEKFHQKCFSFFTEDSAADLENYAALLYQLHITYVALSKNSELAPSLSLKAMEIFGKLKKITVTSRFITERKAKMAVNEITRIGYAGESFEYSRETLNYLLSLKAITDDDRLKTILDEKSLAEQKLRGYLSAICGLLMKHQSDVAISLYRESVKLYANYPENIWWQFKTLAQFVLYFTSDNAFNKEKALEFFYLIKIDSDTPADIAEQRLVLSNNVKTAFWRRNLLADIINFEKSIS
ncbi:MAG: hypothetical protein LBO66_09550 [Deltaproteobacteria bacterium]|nr:hypothetical protein [Deltaproteobacteria bacterium]